MRGVLAVTAVDRVQIFNQRASINSSPVVGDTARRWAITYLAAAMSAPATTT